MYMSFVRTNLATHPLQIWATTVTKKHHFIEEQFGSQSQFAMFDIATYTTPPLTTIRQPRFELGQRAMHMRLNLLDGQASENQTVPGELVLRQTTARLVLDNNRGRALSFAVSTLEKIRICLEICSQTQL